MSAGYAFDWDAYWLARERGEEYDAPAYWCRECGRPEYVGSPENECQVCGAQGPHDSDYYRGRTA